MEFKDFKTNTLYQRIGGAEAHFLYVTDKTEKALYGQSLYFFNDKMEVENFIRR